VDGIQPVSSWFPGSVQWPQGNVNAAAAGAASESIAGASAGMAAGGTTTISSTSTVMSVVHSRVDSMLSSLGLDTQTNEVLRMIIGLLILEALLARDGGSQQAGGAGLQDFGSALRASLLSPLMSYHSETNLVQISHQSTTVSTSWAIQSTGLSGDGSESSGANLDTQA
jgi:hypothetical protein